MHTSVEVYSKLPPLNSRQRAATTKGPLKPRYSKDQHHDHKNGICDYCWNLDVPRTPTLLDETSAGLSDNPFTEDDEEIDDGAFSDSSLSSCLDEEDIPYSYGPASREDGSFEKPYKMTDMRRTSIPVECEIVTRHRVIRRRVARPSLLPSLCQVSYISQEATSGSGIPTVKFMFE